MNIDQVYEKDQKWYCKKCNKEVKYSKKVQKRNTKCYKKGQLIEGWGT